MKNSSAASKKSSHRLMAVIFALVVVACAASLYFTKSAWLKTAYPLKYTAEVDAAAQKYGLDPLFVYAVIRTESGFDPEAESYAGARGLMQLTKDAYDWVNMKKNSTDDDFNSMYSPVENIDYGCFLLKALVDEFETLPETVAAYHAGRGAVNSWLADERYSSDGKTITTVPPKYEKTADYINKVMKSYNIYKDLYKK